MSTGRHVAWVRGDGGGRPPTGRSALIPSVLHIQKTIGLAGSERHLLQLLPALAKRGVRVRMCVLSAGSSHRLVAAMQERGVEVSSIPAGPDLNPMMLARLAREIRRQPTDL